MSSLTIDQRWKTLLWVTELKKRHTRHVGSRMDTSKKQIGIIIAKAIPIVRLYFKPLNPSGEISRKFSGREPIRPHKPAADSPARTDALQQFSHQNHTLAQAFLAT
jgi:hypothetical protein